jgi:hypothetical protein
MGLVFSLVVMLGSILSLEKLYCLPDYYLMYNVLLVEFIYSELSFKEMGEMEL